MLSKDQVDLLRAEAVRRGIDPDALIAAAESPQPSALASSAKDKPNLFMYLLPFVTVNEVRTIWLELDPMAGGEQYAAEWAAKQSAPPATPQDGNPPA